MLDFIFLLAPATQNPDAGPMEKMGPLFMLIAIFVVFYFFMIRPQQKKQKEMQKQRDALKKGDKVVTAGGIYGNIKEVQATTFLIEISKDVTIKVDKGSVFVAAEDAQQEQQTK